MEKKYEAFWIDENEAKVEFKSKNQHCYSCLAEKEMGYGDDISACCCVHCNGPDKD